MAALQGPCMSLNKIQYNYPKKHQDLYLGTLKMSLKWKKYKKLFRQGPGMLADPQSIEISPLKRSFLSPSAKASGLSSEHLDQRGQDVAADAKQLQLEMQLGLYPWDSDPYKLGSYLLYPPITLVIPIFSNHNWSCTQVLCLWPHPWRSSKEAPTQPEHDSWKKAQCHRPLISFLWFPTQGKS